MKGFDSRWKDFPDYIYGVTKEIWEDRNIASLNHYYADDIHVLSPASFLKGNQGVSGATMATLNEFPDRKLLGEDVIWCDASNGGMLSSQRLLSTATYLGDGVYSEATGKSACYRILADCHAINNQINDEWLLRDQGAVVRQMRRDAKQFASDLVEREGGSNACVKPIPPEIDEHGPYTGHGNDDAWGMKYAGILSDVIEAQLSVIPQEYDRGVTGFYPGGQELMCM